MYCGACARDAALIGGLERRGHDVQVVQLYTPMRVDAEDAFVGSPIYIGGITVFLEQLCPVLRWLPTWLPRPLDNPALLRLAGKFAVSTDASTLGPMTISMLQGINGRQRSEVRKLLSYLQSIPRPDIIAISNSLLSGLAPAIKETMHVPVVCGLMGEESFVEGLPAQFQAAAISLIKANAKDIDLFVAPGQGYAASMSEYLAIPSDRIALAPPGVRGPFVEGKAGKSMEPFIVGYLSSIRRSKGLDLLVRAVQLLVEQGRDIELHVAGKALNASYWQGVRSDAARLGERFRYYGEVSPSEKRGYLEACNAFCVPSRIAESRGMAVLEAMAAGLPVLVPDRGIYPELIEVTNGGLLFVHEDASAIAAAIAQLMDNPEEAKMLGNAATNGVAQHYSVDAMVDATLKAYESVTSR